MNKKKLKKEIESISKQLIEKYKPEKIILFGSMAYGNYTSDSDLDLLIVKSGLDEIKGHVRHYQVRKLLSGNMPMDILVYTPYEIKKRLYLGDPFIKKIFSEGKVLYGS